MTLMTHRSLCLAAAGLLLVAPLARAQSAATVPVVNPTEQLSFDRPESWALKYFTSAMLLTGLDTPRTREPGSLSIGFEIGWLPALSDSQRRVGFDGTKSEVEWMVGRLAGEWRDLGNAEPMTVTATHATPFWQWLSRFTPDVEMSFLPSETVGVAARLLRWDPGCSIQAHAGNGVIQLRLPPLPPEEFAAALRKTLRPMAEAAGRTLVVRQTPKGAELTSDDIWGPPGGGHTVAQCLKERFDPRGLFGL